MRARMLLLVLAILVVAGFAAQNWSQITQPSLLNFGVVQATAPLGLILLTLLGLTLLVFLASAASMRTHSLMESRQHAKQLQAQRDLADKAEASRFTDLRGVLDNHLRETQPARADGQRRTRQDALAAPPRTAQPAGADVPPADHADGRAGAAAGQPRHASRARGARRDADGRPRRLRAAGTGGRAGTGARAAGR